MLPAIPSYPYPPKRVFFERLVAAGGLESLGQSDAVRKTSVA